MHFFCVRDRSFSLLKQITDKVQIQIKYSVFVFFFVNQNIQRDSNNKQNLFTLKKKKKREREEFFFFLLQGMWSRSCCKQQVYSNNVSTFSAMKSNGTALQMEHVIRVFDVFRGKCSHTSDVFAHGVCLQLPQPFFFPLPVACQSLALVFRTCRQQI